ncbi:MAG: M6 family metalloprotease domain-containing protein [Acidobacteria bacterium]|nr:M6 family metalloprotease domain-containing protein [Acidobacteriota bacterium]
MRVRECLASVAMVGVAVLAGAVTVDRQPSTFTQPDGSTIVVIAAGDEFNQYWELPSGHTVVLDPAGWWRLATLDADGRLVAAADRSEGGPAQRLAVLPRHLRPRLTGFGPGEAAPVPAGSRAEDVRSLSAGTTVQPLLVILVQFTDRAPVGATAAEFRDAFFGASLSVADYYRDATFGKLEMTPVADSQGTAGDGVVGWLSLPMAHPNYGIKGVTGGSVTQLQKDQAAHAQRLAVKAAIQAADPYVDFAALDRDGSGALDRSELGVVVITAGWEASYGGYKTLFSPANWGHRWSLGFRDEIGQVDAPVVDGMRVGESGSGGGYSSFGEWMQSTGVNTEPLSGNGHRSTIGVMVHELGHDTLGLPDLYDTDGSSAGVGGWCLMGGGSWGNDPAVSPWGGSVPVLLSAWSKLQTDVVRPVDLQGTGTTTAPPAANAPAVYRVGSGIDNEYFLLEYRAPVGWDAGLKRWGDGSFTAGGGLAVWHVDDYVGNNDTESHKRVDLEEANGLTLLDFDENEADRTMLFYGGGVARFADDTNPHAHRYAGDAPSGLAVSSVGQALADGIDFTYAAPNPVGLANDACATALDVPLAPGEERQFAESLVQATGADTPDLCVPLSNTAWYRVTPERTGKLTVEASGFDTVAAVLGGTCETPTVLACNDDTYASGASLIANLAVRRGEPVEVVIGRYGTGRGVGAPLAGRILLAAADPLTVTAQPVTSCSPAATRLTIASGTGGSLAIGPADLHLYLDGAAVAGGALAIQGSGPVMVDFMLGGVAAGHHTLRIEVDTATAAGETEVSFDCLRQVRRHLSR